MAAIPRDSSSIQSINHVNKSRITQSTSRIRKSPLLDVPQRQSKVKSTTTTTGRNAGKAPRASSYKFSKSVTRTSRSEKTSLPLRAKSSNSDPPNPQRRTFKNGGMQKTTSDTSIQKRLESLNLSRDSSKVGLYRRTRSSGKNCHSLDEIASQISSNNLRNIVVMVGAGISTPSGIPDFRTPGSGLYDNLKKFKIPYPEAIFDIDYFHVCPGPFYTLAREIFPTGKYRPNCVHYFLRLLYEKGILLRVYTQNIDGLERIAGIPPQKLVEAHGTFQTASCVKCHQSHSPEQTKVTIFENKFPRCKKDGCLGMVKPDIVFFGEDLPKRFYYYLRDFPQADLLIVMGTSLEVEPFAGIVDSVRYYIPRVLFNRERVGPFKNKHRRTDVIAQGDITEQIWEFACLLGWTTEFKELIAKCEPQTEAIHVVKDQHSKIFTALCDEKSAEKGEDAIEQTPQKNASQRHESSNPHSAHSKKALQSQDNKVLPTTTLDRRRNFQPPRCAFLNSRVCGKPPRDTLANGNAQPRTVNFHAAATLTPLQSFRNLGSGSEYSMNPDLLPRLEYKHGVIKNLAWHNRGTIRCNSSDSSTTECSGSSEDSRDGEE